MTYKSGDVVRLKSGGAPMTIEADVREKDGRWYLVYFTSDGEMRRACLPDSTFKLVTELCSTNTADCTTKSTREKAVEDLVKQLEGIRNSYINKQKKNSP